MSSHSSQIQSNPFYQPAKQWQMRILCHKDHTPAIEEAFGDVALASSSFELDEKAAQWMVEIVTEVSPDDCDLPARMALISGLLEIPTPACELKLLETKDWVKEVESGFPPLHVGRFYIYGSHITTPPPLGKIALEITAGAAFGSGEHATTSGCLKALELLSRKRQFHRTLDMGCGSGILALAMAKLWHQPVLGTDIDPVSVSVARENAQINHMHPLVQFYAGNGYNLAQVRKKQPFDLIIANILARPLVRMAPDLARNLAPGGMAILSGLLDSQECFVMHAHHAQGLRLIMRIPQNGWNTLILEKKECRMKRM